MHAHRPVMSLRPEPAPELARVSGGKIVPLLRERKGFRDVVTSVAEDAGECRRAARPAGLKKSDNVVVGFPKVETFELSNSTFHEIAAKAA